MKYIFCHSATAIILISHSSQTLAYNALSCLRVVWQVSGGYKIGRQKAFCEAENKSGKEGRKIFNVPNTGQNNMLVLGFLWWWFFFLFFFILLLKKGAFRHCQGGRILLIYVIFGLGHYCCCYSLRLLGHFQQILFTLPVLKVLFLLQQAESHSVSHTNSKSFPFIIL